MIKVKENDKKIFKQKGITLIALIITIVLLLILAGISIQVMTNTGIFVKARQAAQESKYANAAEKVALAVNASYDSTGKINNEYLKENVNQIEGLSKKIDTVKYDLKIIVDGFEFTISEYGKITGEKKEVATLPDNTPKTDAGTNVKVPDNWNSQNVKYIKTTDGTEVTTLEKVATVYAVSDGQNNTVPVPNGFYYVGGNMDTGVIISDDEADKYDGKIDKTTWEYTTQLKGNQFVWIPCSKEEYHKTDWGIAYRSTNYDSTTSASEMTQIQKYGGFYIARYEAGLAKTISEYSDTQNSTGSNQIYNKSGIPQSKAGVVPWNFIDWTNSKKNAENMYNTKTVNSGLITGTQWDVMLNKIVEKTDLEIGDLSNSSKWGNYRNTAIKYKGRISKVYQSGGWNVPAFGKVTEGTTEIYNTDATYGDLLTTGASATTQKYHLFDVAGNLIEWTEEMSAFSVDNQYRVARGGTCINSYTDLPACYRFSNNWSEINITAFNLGFRTVLYIK